MSKTVKPHIYNNVGKGNRGTINQIQPRKQIRL